MMRRRSFLGGLAASPALRLNAAPPANAARQLQRRLEATMQDMLRASPELASKLGLDSGASVELKYRLDDRSPEGADAERRRLARQLTRLSAIAPAALGRMDAINLAAVKATLISQEAIARRFSFGAATAARPYVVSPLEGAYSAVPELLTTHHAIAVAEDADAYVERLDRFGIELRHEIERIRHDAAGGVAPPAFLLDRTLRQLALLSTADAAAAALVAPFTEKLRLAGLRGDHERRAGDIVARGLLPALNAQIAALQSLRATAPTAAGVWRLPEGEAYYAAGLRDTCDSEVNPAELHRAGLDHAAAIGARLDSALSAMGYDRGSRVDRLHAIQSEPRYHYPDDDAGRRRLLKDIEAKLDAMSKQLPRYFHRVPHTPLEIRAVPPFLEPGSPFAYYQDPSIDGRRPGIFHINLAAAISLPSWLLETASFHEALPGHHLQQVVLQEGPPLPLIRKVQWSSAYGEGWGLYAEQLADELGLYDQDPSGRIGYLMMALLRAGRLVADTGIHALRWSREEAIAWMARTCGFPEAFVTSEVDRYCTVPAQACSYMVGLDRWNSLRDRARGALGARFDIRDFHQATLSVGAVPLAVLDTVVDAYIADMSGPAPAASS